jgi:poly-gamma-glutamate synthesis protein (capsule biosynthesis protein)
VLKNKFRNINQRVIIKIFKKILYCIIFIGFLFLATRKNNAISNSNQSSITIAFAGDTMLGRLVNEILLQKGPNYIWGNILTALQQADLRIINLETTFTKSIHAVPKVFNFKSDPENVIALNVARIDVVNLANNHTKDFDNEGLFETIITLQNTGILYVGAGKNLQEAHRPVIITKNGIKIGIIGATDNEPTWAATPTHPGVNYFNINNIFSLLEQIKKLKKQVDIAIISLQWGPNMRERPTQEYINAAHAMIDAGADIIHGHSAHIFQGIEIYNDRLIMYDTGDFIDDYHVDPVLRNDWSFLFFVTITKQGITSVQLIPTVIDMMQVNIAQEPEKSRILKRMQQLSSEFGTSISNKGIINIKKE